MKKITIIGLLCIMCLLNACGKNGVGQESNSELISQENASELESENSETKDDSMFTMEYLEMMEETSLDKLIYSITDGNVYIKGCADDVEILVIPDEIEGCPVTTIASYAFRNNKTIKGVKIGNNVTEIWDYAFINCSALEYVIFGNNVKSVGECAFSVCGKMKEIVLNEQLVTVKEGAFCNTVEPLIIPKSVSEIDENAWFGYNVKVYAGSEAEKFIIGLSENFGSLLEYEVIE